MKSTVESCELDSEGKSYMSVVPVLECATTCVLKRYTFLFSFSFSVARRACLSEVTMSRVRWGCGGGGSARLSLVNHERVGVNHLECES